MEGGEALHSQEPPTFPQDRGFGCPQPPGLILAWPSPPSRMFPSTYGLAICSPSCSSWRHLHVPTSLGSAGPSGCFREAVGAWPPSLWGGRNKRPAFIFSTSTPKFKSFLSGIIRASLGGIVTGAPKHILAENSHLIRRAEDQGHHLLSYSSNQEVNG